MRRLKWRRGISLVLTLCVIAGMLSLSPVASVAAEAEPVLNPEIKIVINGNLRQPTDVNGSPVYPISYDGTTYIPVRGLSYLLGKTVGWNVDTRTIEITDEPVTAPDVRVAAESPDRATLTGLRPDPSIKLAYNGEERQLTDINGKPVYPILYSGTNYAPLRGALGLFGITPDWDGATQTISFDIEEDVPDTELPELSDAALAKKLQDTADKYFKSTGNMGVSVGIVLDGEVMFTNYGYTQKGGSAVTENTLFEIASLTKTFTGTVLADLANRGKLSLDDPLEKYFDFPIAGYNGTPIRLIDLATHTSGLPRMPTNWKNSGDPYKDYDEAMLLEYLKTAKPATTPGKTYLYSNLGMGILGYVIEQVTGKPYEQVVRETICEELGLNNTAVTLSAEQESMRATPHLANGSVTNAWTYDALMACGGLKSSVYDMTRYIAANFSDLETGTQLQAAFSTAQKTHWTGGNRTMGLAWHKGQLNGNPVLDHTGLTGGYSSAIVLCPDKSAGVIVLCNNGDSDGDVINLSYELMKVLVG